MNKSMLERLGRAEKKAEPPRPFVIVMHVVHLVDDDDPRCGTWAEQPEDQTTFPTIRFYGRDLAHLDELRARHKAEAQTDIEFTTKPARGPLILTGEGESYLGDLETVGELLTTANTHNPEFFSK